MRWPGYLGERYEPEQGVLCVGAVHRQGTTELHVRDPVNAATDGELVSVTRSWLTEGRSAASESATCTGCGRPTFARFRRGRGGGGTSARWSRTTSAWIARRSRTPILRSVACRSTAAPNTRAAEATLTRLCQRAYPIAELAEALRPAAVLVAVLGGRPGGDIVSRWSSPTWSPLVYAWQGQSGHDRHNTAPGARPLHEWAPEMVEEVRSVPT